VAAGQRTKTGSTGYKTGSTGFAAVWTVKARRKQRWLRGIPAKLTAQSARLTTQTGSADAEATKTGSTSFYTGSTGFHQRKTGWVAYSADLLNLFWDIAR
jgi:hypothetical protein